MVLHSPICPPVTRAIAAWLFAAVLGLAATTLAQAPQTPAQTPAQASAQTSTTISTQSPAPADSVTAVTSGIVHTSDGFPVPGATLRLVNTDTQKVFVSWTDESGKFEFPALPPGYYTVEASQLGFVAASLNIELGGGPAPPPLQFVLRVGTLAELAAPTGPSGRQGGRRPGAGPGTGTGAPNGGQPGASNPQSASGTGAPGGGRGRGGRGQQLPPGLLNAVRDGGFQQTDLTGEAAAGQADAAAGGPQPS